MKTEVARTSKNVTTHDGCGVVPPKIVVQGSISLITAKTVNLYPSSIPSEGTSRPGEDGLQNVNENDNSEDSKDDREEQSHADGKDHDNH